MVRRDDEEPGHTRVVAVLRARARIAVVAGIAALVGCSPMTVGRPARPIPSTRHAPYLESVQAEVTLRSEPLPASTLPRHPHMAANGASCMHSDSLTTNTYAWEGPRGRDAEVSSRAMGFLGGECPTINFDRQGRLVAVCVHNRTPSLVMLDPTTLDVLERRQLPHRNTPRLHFRSAADDTSGGAYFYLDERDRAVIGAADGAIHIISTQTHDGVPRFRLDERIDLSSALTRPNGSLDKITAVMPDWQGRYWFVGRHGTVGYVDAERRVRSLALEGEEIENSFSVSADGVYVVSDHALYRFDEGMDGRPHVVWREVYDRGSRRKIGQINRGSGTTPTLLGDDYVAITDNAEPRMHVLVFRRGRGVSARRVCQTPVFRAGRSATENTLIGYDRSLIVENNADYDIFFTMRHGRTSAPGLARVDLRPDDSGCDVVWESEVTSQTAVPKLSTATGLIYVYAKRPYITDGSDAYYLTGIDFRTGITAFSVLTGTGVRFDNHWAAVTLAADGTAFVGVLNGLVRIRDRQGG